MAEDCRGLTLTTGSEQAAARFDHAVDGFLGYRSDLAVRLDTVLTTDPALGMAHCLKGYLLLMSFRADLLPAAQAASGEAMRRVVDATEREQAHAGTLDAWAAAPDGEGGEEHPSARLKLQDQIVRLTEELDATRKLRTTGAMPPGLSAEDFAGLLVEQMAPATRRRFLAAVQKAVENEARQDRLEEGVKGKRKR